MAVTGLTIAWQSGALYRLAWSGAAGATFGVYVNGALELTTAASAAVLALDDGDTVDVIETTETPPAETRPRRATLSWRPVSGAVEYRIDESVDAVWTKRQTVPEDGQSFYTWRTRVLEDCTTHSFRIVALDAAGNESDAELLTFFFVRVPDAPALAGEWDEGTLTLTAT